VYVKSHLCSSLKMLSHKKNPVKQWMVESEQRLSNTVFFSSKRRLLPTMAAAPTLINRGPPTTLLICTSAANCVKKLSSGHPIRKLYGYFTYPGNKINAVVMWLVFFPQHNHVVRDLMLVVCLYLFPNKLILSVSETHISPRHSMHIPQKMLGVVMFELKFLLSP